MLGTDVCATLDERGIDRTTARGRGELDLTDADAVAEAVAGHDVVVNCAAWTAVDNAEEHEAEAFAVNAVGARPPGAGRCARARARGSCTSAPTTSSTATRPRRTPRTRRSRPRRRTGGPRPRASGPSVPRRREQHLIVRTAWLYGAHGACFPQDHRPGGRRAGRLDVVDDQVGQPTWTRDLAELMVRLVAADAPAGT